MRPLLDELLQQPAAFREMAAWYQKERHRLDLEHLSPTGRWVLTGMGASYHAAWVGAMHLNSLGIQAEAVEAVDLLHYRANLLRDENSIIYISQSGDSGEITPLLERLSPSAALIAITNNPSSPLARRASLVLPILGGTEAYIASKTYINPLAILWLAARRLGKTTEGSEWDALERTAARIEVALASAEQIAGQMFSSFDLRQPLLFTGHGPHAATARQAAMVLSEWAKFPALNAGIGAFRHGFIETIRPGYGVIVFTPPGPTRSSAVKLAGELSSYGANVLCIENGRVQKPGENPVPSETNSSGVDEFLSPILDIIPVQIFTEYLAYELGLTPGFNYISKVVRSL
ncbi:MAG: SIS domain-containing protein [Chloroflexi bacterium]|nr:MAG: SIS domain-containing protein [Chloroflexota bacterium]